MKHIEIKLSCIGDIVTSASIALRISKELNEVVYLEFPHHGNFLIGVHPESYCSDLVSIVMLEIEVRKNIPI